MARFKLHGVPEMRRRLQDVQKQFPRRVGAALYMEGQIEMTEAKRRTPVDVTAPTPHPGQLRASGTVHEPEYNGNRISVTLSFGGAARDYAIWVHELLDNFHVIGQAKYLESVINESRGWMAARVAARLKL